MKKTLLLFILACCATSLWGQSLTFDKKTHDFGDIRETAGKVSCVFTLTNRSDKPFVIAYITTGCGCTAVKYDKAPILPGQTRQLTIQYDPAERSGHFNSAILITGASPKEDYKLSVTGSVLPKEKTIKERYPILLKNGLRLDQEKIVYGVIPGNEDHTLVLKYFNDSPKQMTLSVAEPQTKNASAMLTKTTLRPQEEGVLMFRLNLSGDKTLGSIRDKVVLNASGQPTEIPVSATVITNPFDATAEEARNAPIAVLPVNFYYFYPAKSGDQLVRSFEIRNDGKTDLVVEKIETESDELSYSISATRIKPYQKAELTLTWDTKKGKGEVSVRTTLFFNSVQTPIKNITLSAKLE